MYLELAVKSVIDRATYCREKVPQWDYKRHLCYAALEYVTGHVSAPQYGADRMIETDAETILAKQEGICGHAGIALQAILTKCKVSNKHVEIYQADGGGHVAVEAGWGRTWHYLDPTWGTIYVKDDRVLNLKQILAYGDMKEAYQVTFGSQYWRNVVERVPGGPNATGLSALDNPIYITSGGSVILDKRKGDRTLMVSREFWKDSII